MICENKVQLIESPSALEYLPKLSRYLNGPEIYIKRDDIIGRSGGGNKYRKYENIIGKAVSEGCDTLIIAGHFQSNAARELVGAACQLGLQAVVVCKELIPEQNLSFSKNGNALLMNIMGAKILTIGQDEDYNMAMNDVAEQVIRNGRKPYIIPFGGSSVLGAMSYANCVDEMVAQCEKLPFNFPDYIFTATGSGGTQAGLITGVLKNNLNTKVVGISVLHNKVEAEKIVSGLTDQSVAALNIRVKQPSHDLIQVDDAFIGKGYGIITAESIATIRLLAQLEGLFLCPVYTAKAMTGLIAHIQSGRIRKGESVVFIHTGGFPLIFAYYDKLHSEDPSDVEPGIGKKDCKL